MVTGNDMKITFLDPDTLEWREVGDQPELDFSSIEQRVVMSSAGAAYGFSDEEWVKLSTAEQASIATIAARSRTPEQKALDYADHYSGGERRVAVVGHHATGRMSAAVTAALAMSLMAPVHASNGDIMGLTRPPDPLPDWDGPSIYNIHDPNLESSSYGTGRSQGARVSAYDRRRAKAKAARKARKLNRRKK